MLQDFRDFILRYNVVALAIAVVIGVAFGAVITSFVQDLLTPLIAAIGGQPDFSGLDFTINNSVFRYGEFINAVVSFLIIAAIVFFLVIVPMNRFLAATKKDDPLVVPEYEAVTATSASDLAREVNRRAEDGWRVVSMSNGNGRELTAVLVKE